MNVLKKSKRALYDLNDLLGHTSFYKNLHLFHVSIHTNYYQNRFINVCVRKKAKIP